MNKIICGFVQSSRSSSSAKFFRSCEVASGRAQFIYVLNGEGLGGFKPDGPSTGVSPRTTMEGEGKLGSNAARVHAATSA